MTKKSYALAGKWSIAAAVALSAALSGCDGGPKPGSARGSGSAAMSQDSALVYAADTDNGQLIAVDAKKAEVVAKISVGLRPYRVAVGKDDTIYVANRGSRSVSVIRRGEWTVAGELSTDVDPIGLAVSPDGKKVIVASAAASDSTDYGTLAQFDAATLQRDWTMKLSDEPRAIAMIDDHTAAVGLYRAGDVVMVDLAHQAIVQSKTDLYERTNASALAAQANGSVGASAVTFHARGLTDLAVAPDGKRVFATTLLSREAAILTQPTPATPYYESQGPRLAGSVATPAVATFDVSGAVLSPRVDDLGGYGYGTTPQYNSDGTIASEPNFPQTSFSTTGYDANETLVQGPTAIVVDSLGDWVYVVNRDSRNVMVLPANRRTAQPAATGTSADYSKSYANLSELPSVFTAGDIGAGADGIAVSGDNKSFFIYSQFDHQLVQYQLSGDHVTLEQKQAVTCASDTLDSELALGRREFYDATDRRISARSAAISCGSCHLEGREDSHVWNFPDGPRQTPSLAGRGLLETQPYHWSGEFPTLTEFLNHTVTARMGGTGIDTLAANRLDGYIASLPAPENPNVLSAPSDAQLRGAAVFNQAGCGACHSGQWLTNDTNADVGTLTPADNGLVVQNGINVPSLRGLARTAPYLHDGSASTLELRVRNNPGDKHGVTSNLNDQQIGDLVAYLKSL